jgi:hypothetical protein
MPTIYYTPTKHEVETFSGQYLDVQNPDPDKINLEDIAHALGNICRYGGHSRTFYSVAEHSVFVCERVCRQGWSKNLQLAALHHDDAEAYLGDIPRPLKPLLGGEYARLTRKMDRAIVIGLQLPFLSEEFHHSAISNADDWSVFVEARDLLPSEGRGWTGHPDKDTEIPSRIVIPDYYRGGISPAAAADLFLERHYSLIE